MIETMELALKVIAGACLSTIAVFALTAIAVAGMMWGNGDE